MNSRKITDMHNFCNEENLLLAASNGYVSTYIYDGEGKRTVKQHSGSEAVYTNGTRAAMRAEAPHYSLYANPYFVMTDGDKYTEHIYIGSERIAVRVAKLSDESSVLGNFDEEEMAGQGIVVGGIDYGVKRKAQEQVIEDCYDSLQFAYLLVDRRDLVNIGMVPSGADTSDVDDSDEERGTANPDTEWKRVYYYSTDHLGSSRLVLNSNGLIVERLNFLPTGEVFVDEQNTTDYHSDFLFSGKEMDAETGNYYFGARYLAPRLGSWLSPDPMQLKYPHVSSYSFCHNNPLNRIDLMGMDDYQLDREGNMSIIKQTKDDFHRVYPTSDTRMAASFFEFAAKNTDVEWSITNVHSRSGYSSILSTSHDYGTEVGMVKLFDDISNDYDPWTHMPNSIIVSNIHSHEYGNFTVSPGDKKFVTKAHSRFPLAQFYIYDKNKYHLYTPKSTSGQIGEVVVFGRRSKQ